MSQQIYNVFVIVEQPDAQFAGEMLWQKIRN